MNPTLLALYGLKWNPFSPELPTEAGFDHPLSQPEDVYRRPYEGADHAAAAKQAYLDWEFGLVDQLARDGTHGFVVI